ncbi:MAG TPA: flagellar filament capping protein FliD [Nitrospiraceae bacterium]|nr:flagellar filament capping protein FliD [Nitrospiraceae bacterium]
MANISVGGLGNNFDFGPVIAQLVAVQQSPIDRLSENKKALQDKLTDYGTLGANLLKLQSAAGALRRTANFDRVAVTVGNDDILTATASGSAAPGSYTLQVSQLATAHQLINKASKAVSSPTADIVSGGSATFTFALGGGAAQTITLGDTATLEDLKTGINDLGAGVSASLLNVGTESAPSYRLVLTATKTGIDSTITITTDTTDLDFVNITGTGGADTLQAAQNAIVVVGDPDQTPIALQRSTNTITDALPGVTLSLKAVTPEDTTVNVSASLDPASTKTDIKALVTAYNDVVKFINERTTYDTDQKKGGVLFGEGAPRTVLTRLRESLSDNVGGLTGITAVGRIGFKTDRDGTIALDESALDKSLAENYTAVRDLFITKPDSTGVAQRLFDAVDVLDDVETGSLTVRKNRLTGEIKSFSDQIARKEDALSAYEERLRRQYATLDGLLRQMQGQLDFLRSRL